MTYVIRGLNPTPFRSLFAQDEAALAERLATRVTCDAAPGFPCRVSLRDAAGGETLVLVHWEHQSAATPYRASHAVFVHEGAERACFVDEVPDVLARRTLSLRAFDRVGSMVDAAVVEGRALDPLIREWLDRPEVHTLHAHNAAPGCFAAAIVRG